MEKATDSLDAILKNTNPEQVEAFLETNQGELIQEEKPFSKYIKHCIREKGLKQQDVFLRADLSDSYGYKLLSGEKHTSQRDTILRLCLGAKLTLEETQRALKMYGMSPLYSRVPRDAALMVAILREITELADVNAYLQEHGMPPLKGTDY